MTGDAGGVESSVNTADEEHFHGLERTYAAAVHGSLYLPSRIRLADVTGYPESGR